MPMTFDNPRYFEFIDRLAGPGACNFRQNPIEGMTWDCKGGTDKTFAEAILRDMGYGDVEIASTFAYLEARGGFCDCEIVLNVDRTAADESIRDLDLDLTAQDLFIRDLDLDLQENL
jgi:hypothetical protein